MLRESRARGQTEPFRIAEARADQRVLVLVPSLSLLRQFRREWLETADASRPLADLCVCSDTTVAGGHVRGYSDDLVERAADLGVPVTSDPATIAAFLRLTGRRVVFGTYQSSARIAEAMAEPDVPPFDLVVADEAHRLAAGTDRTFATVLDGGRIRAHRRLFATATPRVVTAAVRQRAADADLEVVSMDDPAVFGAVAHRLSFGQAIAEDLLSDYRVVVLVTSDAEVAHLVSERRLVRSADEAVTDAATLAALAGTVRSIATLGLRRLISFHRTIRRAADFATALMERPSSDQPSIAASFVSGAMTSGERAQRLERLRAANGDAVLLANARCLTEGVDVPGLDGVVFVDPRWSPIDIVQAVGRVIRRADDKSVGTILIPVVVPESANPEALLEHSGFATVWAVVRALRSHDERLAEELSRARMSLGRTGRVGRSSFLTDHIGVLDLPLTIDPARFADAIDLRIVQAGSFDFDEGLGRLRHFVEREGHARVAPLHVERGARLGGWVHLQRTKYGRGELREERAIVLEAVPGWTWRPFDDDFVDGLRTLRAYVAREGHARVPQRHREGEVPLGTWINGVRLSQRAGRLSADRARTLEDLPGWVWDAHAETFERGLQALRAYALREGHLRPPRDHVEGGVRLMTWASQRRSDYRKGRLTPDEVASLESVPNWAWDPQAIEWAEGIAALQAYVARNGNARVPKLHREGAFRLGGWVIDRRVEHGRGELSAARVAELAALV
ncbi:MAG: hypothetical protein NVS9B8_15180 [Candidatus Limnocylindrales bacterium]